MNHNSNINVKYYGHGYNRIKSFDDLVKLPNYDNIRILEISYTNYEEIPTLPKKLVQLNASHNHNLIKIPELPGTLTHIWCHHNTSLEILPVLPYSIRMLDCSHCIITHLPNMPNDLVTLCCNYNNITEIMELPNNISYVDCSNNRINKLPILLPDNIKQFSCNFNYLTELPINVGNVPKVSYLGNPVYSDVENIVNPLQLYSRFQKKLKIKNANKIKNWFLDCKYNPKYKYCRDRLLREHKELF